MKPFIRAGICLFSAGWIFPAWLGVHSCLNFWGLEIRPLLYGKPLINSFPFIQFSQECFAVSLLWLAAVVLYWSWNGTGSSQSR
jgi:hypothetical protein